MISVPTDQRPIRLWQLLFLGYMLHKIESCQEDEPLASPDRGPLGVIDSLDTILEALGRFELQEADGFARFSVWRLMHRLIKRRERGEITLGAHAADLQHVLPQLFSTIQDEASRKYMYPARPIPGVPVDRLIDEPRREFGLPDEIKPPLPSEVDNFLAEAGRCLVVGFESAAIYCIVAATEHVAKYYYQTVTGGPPPGRSTWGQWNPVLAKREHNCPDDLINALQDIVEKYRNPVMHGQLVIDKHTASDVWRICSDAAQEIIRDLVNRKLITVSEVVYS